MKKASLFAVAAMFAFVASPLRAASPANDNLASAATLSGDVASDVTTNVEATQEPGDFAYRTLWWTWTAPATGRVTFDAVNSVSYYLNMRVWLKESTGEMGGIVATANGSSSTSPSVSFPVIQGNTYVIGLGTSDSFPSYAGTVRIALSLNRQDFIAGLPITLPVTSKNDAFAQRIPLTGVAVSGMCYSTSATLEAGEPSQTGYKSSWWSWTAPATGRLTISSQGSDSNLPKAIAAFTGTSLANLRVVQSGVSSSQVTLSFPVTAGSVYQVSIGNRDGYSNDGGPLVLGFSLDTTADVSQMNIQGMVSTVNDSFAQRILLTGNVVSAMSYNLASSLEAGEPAASCYKTMWYTYRPAATGRLTLTTQGSDNSFSKAIGVYLGSSFANLKYVRSLTSSSSISFSIPVTAGTDYQISIGNRDNYSSDGGTLILGLSLNAGADVSLLNIPNEVTFANDNFAQRVSLTGSSVVSAIGYNEIATNETGEPTEAGYHTLWYTYRPAANGVLSIGAQGSDEEGLNLAAFIGNSLSSLRIAAGRSASSVAAAGFSFPVTAGVDYQISIGNRDNYNYYGRSLVLSVSLSTSATISTLNIPNPASAANDFFANRVALSGDVVSAIGYNVGAGRDALEPTDSRYRTLWWTWTARANGTATVDLAYSDAITKCLSVWTGGSLEVLQNVAIARNSNAPKASFSVVAGTTYQIAAGNDESYTSGGTIVISVAGPSAIPTVPGALASQLLAVNEPLALSASSEPNTTYQWLRNSSPIGGAITNTYGIGAIALAQAGSYSLKATNNVGVSTSNICNVGVVFAPGGSVTVGEGGTVSLTFQTSSPVALKYRWRKGGVDLADGKVGKHTLSGTGTIKLTIAGFEPADVASYTCVVSMANPLLSGEVLIKETAAFSVAIQYKPVVTNTLPFVWYVSGAVTDSVGASNGATAFLVKGLPAGVVYNTATGQLSGKPSAPVAQGSFTVTATNGAGAGVAKTLSYSVLALVSSSTGAFNGLIDRSTTITGAGFGGSLSLNILTTGNYTGSLRLGSKTYPLSNRLNAAPGGLSSGSHTIGRGTGVPALTLSFDIDDEGVLTGVLSDGSSTTNVSAWRNGWSAANPADTLAGAHTLAFALPAGAAEIGDVAVPQGNGYGFVTITRTGGVTFSGALADGAALTLTTTLGPDGQIPLHWMLYVVDSGALHGLAQATASAVGVPWLDGFVEWTKNSQPTSSTIRAYKSGFARHSQSLIGGLYVKPASLDLVLDLNPGAGNAGLFFTNGGLAMTSA